ncbi:MAG: DUF4160 domain-containing protein [Parabacteroides sp.]|nr:DUF4160 domain-containing protein [Parabacteroides sp.]
MVDSVVDAKSQPRSQPEPEIKLVENRGFKHKDIKRAMFIVEQYKEEFIEKWKEFHGE